MSSRLSPESVLCRYEWLPFGDSIRMWCFLLLLRLGSNLLLDSNRLGMLRRIRNIKEVSYTKRSVQTSESKTRMGEHLRAFEVRLDY